MFEKFFGNKAEAKPFNFTEAYQFLKQEQKAAMFQAIAVYKSAAEAERNSALWALDDVAKEVLREEKLSTDLETVQEFRNGFLNIPNQSNYIETASSTSPDTDENKVEVATMQAHTKDDVVAPRVEPRRVSSTWTQVLNDVSNKTPMNTSSVGDSESIETVSFVEKEDGLPSNVTRQIPRELQPDELRHRPQLTPRRLENQTFDQTISSETVYPKRPPQTL